MASSEEANLPRFAGKAPFYEIWFLVVFDYEARRAYWFRYTLFAPAPGTRDEPRATVWAAAFDAGADVPAVAGKSILPLSAFDAGSAKDRFGVRIGDDAAIGHGTCRGDVAAGGHRIAWDLRFRPADHTVTRTPKIAELLPLSTHAAHANDDVPFDGWVEIDGTRRVVERAAGTQMHIWGTKRVEQLFWIRGGSFEEDTAARLEVTSVGPVTSLWLATRNDTIDHREPPAALSAKVTTLAADARGVVLEVESRSGSRLVRVRAHCDLRTLVGYVYRDPAGRDLYVAQSDIASCDVEIFSRRLPIGPFSLDRTLSSDRRAALEIHGPEPLPGIRYIGWDETSAPLEPNVPLSRSLRAPDEADRGDGAFEKLPEPRSIVALGLTYREHVRETSSEGGAAVFLKGRASWLPEGDRISIPTHDEMLAALDVVDPGLAAKLRARVPILPPILDYEVELAMMILEPSAHGSPRVGWFVANDLTARSCQVLGSGTPDPMPYWTVAKSFPGFLPVTPRMWVPAEPGKIPDVLLTTRVNGVVRQSTRTSSIALGMNELLSKAATALGRDLEHGDVVLTGTPSGVAFGVSRAKRWLGERVLDRIGRVRAAAAMYAQSTKFLRPGDRVEVAGGFLGSREVVIGARRD